MRPMAAIFSLLIAAIGWYYLFYSQASQRLEGIEDQRDNHRRGILRRVNAIVILLMALGIAFGTFHFREDTLEFLLDWAAVLLLLLVSVILALIDLRLTMKLRHRLRERKNQQ